MYHFDFSCSSIFHQLWTHIGYIKGKKVRLIFHSFLAHFSPPGRLPNATTTPWKVFLRVSWQSTFQLGPMKAQKPLVAKIKFWGPKPERGLNHYPIKKLSPLCIVSITRYKLLLFAKLNAIAHSHPKRRGKKRQIWNVRVSAHDEWKIS